MTERTLVTGVVRFVFGLLCLYFLYHVKRAGQAVSG